MKHDWKIGWKGHKLKSWMPQDLGLIRDYSVDICKNCGALEVHLIGAPFYISPQNATRFLTTDKPVRVCEYFECVGKQ